MLPVVSLMLLVGPHDLTLQMFLVCLDNASTLNYNQPPACLLRAPTIAYLSLVWAPVIVLVART